MIIVEIAGFLGADPEERFTSSGKRVVSLRVATKVRKGGQDDTVWWRVSIWDNEHDRMLPYLKKGSSVIVIGDMDKPETYVAKDGSTQISMSMSARMIKFSPFGKPDQGKEQQAAAPAAVVQEEQQFATTGAAQTNDTFAGDDLPF